MQDRRRPGRHVRARPHDDRRGDVSELVVRDEGPSTHSSEASEALIRAVKRRILLAPVISALAILVSFASPFVSRLMHALLPPFYILPGSIDRHVVRRRY